MSDGSNQQPPYGQSPQQPPYGQNPQQPPQFGGAAGYPGAPNQYPGAQAPAGNGQQPPYGGQNSPYGGGQNSPYGAPGAGPQGYGGPQYGAAGAYPQAGYGGPVIGQDGLKYDPTGKPRYPGTYLASIIILSIGVAAGIFGIITSVANVNEIAEWLGEDNEVVGQLRVLMYMTIATFIINVGAFIGIVLGFPWGRIVYTAVFVVNTIAVIVVLSGIRELSAPVPWPSLLLPILVIVFLWLPTSTAYIKAMARYRQGQSGAQASPATY